MPDSKKRDTRARMLGALKRELMGPSDPNETLATEFPTSRYIVGRLAPLPADEDDHDAEISDLEKDDFAVGSDDDEGGASEFQPPLIVGFSPSSFGLSFLLEPNVNALTARVTWGDYKRESNQDEGGTHWQRYPQEALVEGISVATTGSIGQIILSPSEAPPGVTVTGVDDLEVTIEGVVHDIDGQRAVSLFLVNRRTKGETGDKTKDERWLMQPRLEVTASSGEAVFRAKRFGAEGANKSADEEVLIANLMYRHAREFATGHGVAAGWDGVTEDGTHVSKIYTDFIPDFEVPSLIAPSDATGGAELDMYNLSQAKNHAQLSAWLAPMLDAYEQWIDDRRNDVAIPPISSSKDHADTAKELIQRCADAAARMRAGLSLLGSDPIAFESFKFANQVMWDQRIHSIWANYNRDLAEAAKGAEEDSKPAEPPKPASAFDLPSNRTWRPFQMGFILLNIQGIAVETSSDRRLVDLLWFPTGGGKTEAYLGIAAFTMAYRRLLGDKSGMNAGAGVNIIMRYTLRLLTVQQFQRAAALICSCELVRKGDERKWGDEPFRIGLWVGRKTTPNDAKSSQTALQDLNDRNQPRDGSPVQLLSCPRCGTSLASEKGRPENQTYSYDDQRQRTLVRCRNRDCDFCHRKSNGEGIPVVVVDEELYRTCPSLIIATVDKFARMPFKGETQSLFGLRDRYSPTYGHLTPGHGDKVGGRKIRDAKPAPRLLPPELIIQDELHLISGPLGTMVGLYETAIDFLTRVQHESGESIPAKVIASTATIRRARQQVRQLYNQDLRIFPPSGLSARDSFFAREVPIDPADDRSSGRVYVGLNAPGSSSKTLLVRVYSALLAAGQAELDNDANSADPYATLVGYFNSLRALGGAVRLVEDDVRNVRLWYLHKQRGFPRRYIDEPRELTSRLNSVEIPGLLKKLDAHFPRVKGQLRPVDVLLATNMISVGVDIDRLGLMVVTGQPKTTAEYIQATSRVGRKHPGLVLTMYNWMGPRDMSHYERFRSYHAALYRYVEAISVTPFSSRALDRGLRGMFASIQRLSGQSMACQKQAQNFNPVAQHTADIMAEIVARAGALVGTANGHLVNDRLQSHRDEWAKLADDLLLYSWLRDNMPPQNSKVLLKTAGSENEGEWLTPGSLREVEPTAAFYLSEEEG